PPSFGSDLVTPTMHSTVSPSLKRRAPPSDSDSPPLRPTRRTADEPLLAQTIANTRFNRNMSRLFVPLFQDYHSQHSQNYNYDDHTDTETDDGDYDDKDQDSSDEENDSDSDDDDNDDDENEVNYNSVAIDESSSDDDSDNDGDRRRDQQAREVSSKIINLSKVSPSPSSSQENVSQATEEPVLAVQSLRQSSKRVRIDPASGLHRKRVRFNLAKNQIFRPSSPSQQALQVYNPRPWWMPSEISRPVLKPALKPALVRRPNDMGPQSFPDTFSQPLSQQEPFTLSLENTSQDVLNFASSLSRLMGSSSNGSLDQQTMGSSPSSSPLRTFMFKNAPPSPVRPAYMSYMSPPPRSSLSSSWSMSMDEDNSMMDAASYNSDNDRLLRRPAAFSPRRPRVTTLATGATAVAAGTVQVGGGAEGSNTSQTGTSAAPSGLYRMPSLLKREVSFMDNLVPGLKPEPTPESPLQD
ncbi:hypothetical protein BGW38_007278, partial [Lunasporangiospora selenospora]